MPNIDPAWIAVIGTICGGVALKLIEHWLGKSRIRIDEARSLRDELRIQIVEQKEEIKHLESELDRWKKDYFDLRDKYTVLNTEYLIALEKIKKEAEAAARKADPTIDPPPPV